MKNLPVIDAFGTKRWYQKGFQVHELGVPRLYKDPILHRDDGPAVIYEDGTELWYKDGFLHRDDGPAAILYGGLLRWAKYGKLYQPSAHELITWKMNEKNKNNT